MSAKHVWQGTREELDRLSLVLTELAVPAADAVSLVKSDPREADHETDWSLHAYYEELPTLQAIEGLLSEHDLAHLSAIEEALPEIDWVAHALEGLGVVKAGRFILYGSHDAEKAKGMDGLPLQVEANRAFGTGHHPTTAGCLEALSRLDAIPVRRILDVGTGSGVLAMAARRLWPDAEIIGTDIDEPSIDIARENAALNGIEDVDFRHADGLGEHALGGKFDLILANILAEPLIGLAPDISDALAQGGILVLAGLLDRQESGVTEAYGNQQLAVVDRVDAEQTWPVLVLRRSM